MHAASTVDDDGKCLKDTPASMDRMTDGCFRKFSDRKLKNYTLTRRWRTFILIVENLRHGADIRVASRMIRTSKRSNERPMSFGTVLDFGECNLISITHDAMRTVFPSSHYSSGKFINCVC